MLAGRIASRLGRQVQRICPRAVPPPQAGGVWGSEPTSASAPTPTMTTCPPCKTWTPRQKTTATPTKQTSSTSTSQRRRRSTMPPTTPAPSTRHEAQLYHGFDHYPPSTVYRLVEPGPVLLVSTGCLADGTHNIMTIGFHMVVQHESPPLLGISLGPWDASHAALKKHRQCVLAVPDVAIASLVVDIGNCSADDADVVESGGKWARFGLQAVAAREVTAPLVGGPDVIANIECVVEDTKMVAKYNMWVLKPVKAWINPARRPGEGGTMFHHRGDGTFSVDGRVLDLKERMVKWQEFQD